MKKALLVASGQRQGPDERLRRVVRAQGGDPEGSLERVAGMRLSSARGSSIPRNTLWFQRVTAIWV